MVVPFPDTRLAYLPTVLTPPIPTSYHHHKHTRARRHAQPQSAMTEGAWSPCRLTSTSLDSLAGGVFSSTDGFLSTEIASTCRDTILPLATLSYTTTGQARGGPPLTTAESSFFPPGRQPLGGVFGGGGGEKRSIDSNRILSPTDVVTDHSLIATVTATQNNSDNRRTDIPGIYSGVNGHFSASSTTDCVFNQRDRSYHGASSSFTPSTARTEPVAPDSQKHPYLGVAGKSNLSVGVGAHCVLYFYDPLSDN
ncbi:unnamed protein product [Schistocephalus solidus]|uniref:Uncharacterized protein n=1 Tax=Schistocephalus solidus TaxID=70667 RepID=A0A183S9H0_SCHSO|nr:unnamed protein product [Schistocephalus solidus]